MNTIIAEVNEHHENIVIAIGATIVGVTWVICHAVVRIKRSNRTEDRDDESWPTA